MTDFKNLWGKSSTVYAYYAGHYPQYIDTSQKIVELANIQSDDVVIDLGAGTGLTSREIGKRLDK